MLIDRQVMLGNGEIRGENEFCLRGKGNKQMRQASVDLLCQVPEGGLVRCVPGYALSTLAVRHRRVGMWRSHEFSALERRSDSNSSGVVVEERISGLVPGLIEAEGRRCIYVSPGRPPHRQFQAGTRVSCLRQFQDTTSTDKRTPYLSSLVKHELHTVLAPTHGHSNHRGEYTHPQMCFGAI